MSRPLLGVHSSSECTGVDRLLWVNPSGVSELLSNPVPKRILGIAAYPRIFIFVYPSFGSTISKLEKRPWCKTPPIFSSVSSRFLSRTPEESSRSSEW